MRRAMVMAVLVSGATAGAQSQDPDRFAMGLVRLSHDYTAEERAACSAEVQADDDAKKRRGDVDFAKKDFDRAQADYFACFQKHTGMCGEETKLVRELRVVYAKAYESWKTAPRMQQTDRDLSDCISRARADADREAEAKLAEAARLAAAEAAKKKPRTAGHKREQRASTTTADGAEAEALVEIFKEHVRACCNMPAVMYTSRQKQQCVAWGLAKCVGAE